MKARANRPQAARRDMAAVSFSCRDSCQRPALLFWCIRKPTLSRTRAANTEPSPSLTSRLAPLMVTSYVAATHVRPPATSALIQPPCT